MGKMPKEVRDRISKAKATAGGTNISHGKHILMLMKSTYERMNSGQCHINEFVVFESEGMRVTEGEKSYDVAAMTKGASCSYVINYDGKGKLSADGNSKALVLGLFGEKEGEIPDDKVSETLGDLTDDAQPAKGMLVRVETYPKEVRSKPGKYITGLNWSCVDKPGEGLNAPDEVTKRLTEHAKVQATKAEKAA